MAYPEGATTLYVERSGQSRLTYGALPQFQQLKTGTFNIDDLYQHLLPRLHENTPKEEWPNPKSEAGTVTIIYSNDARKIYLLLDANKFTEELFSEARKNRLDTTPEPWAF